MRFALDDILVIHLNSLLYGLHHALVILKANVEGWESWGGQKLLQGAHCSNISLCV